MSNIQDTRLEVLMAERDLLESAYNAQYSYIMCELDTLINKWFVSPFNAKCLRMWLREEWLPERGIIINFEIGFHNVEEDRTDFGSDISFMYSYKDNCLSANYGTCGTYNKNNIYQVRRVQTLTHVWNNINDIEAELGQFSEKITPVVIQYRDNIDSVEHEILAIQSHMKEERCAEIESMFRVGLRMTYCETNLDKSIMLFPYTATINKITPKLVTVVSKSKEYKLRKKDIVQHIFKNYIEIEDNE